MTKNVPLFVLYRVFELSSWLMLLSLILRNQSRWEYSLCWSVPVPMGQRSKGRRRSGSTHLNLQVKIQNQFHPTEVSKSKDQPYIVNCDGKESNWSPNLFLTWFTPFKQALSKSVPIILPLKMVTFEKHFKNNYSGYEDSNVHGM